MLYYFINSYMCFLNHRDTRTLSFTKSLCYPVPPRLCGSNRKVTLLQNHKDISTHCLRTTINSLLSSQFLLGITALGFGFTFFGLGGSAVLAGVGFELVLAPLFTSAAVLLITVSREDKVGFSAGIAFVTVVSLFSCCA